MSGRHWIITCAITLTIGIVLAILISITPPVIELPHHPTPTPTTAPTDIQLPTL